MSLDLVGRDVPAVFPCPCLRFGQNSSRASRRHASHVSVLRASQVCLVKRSCVHCGPVSYDSQVDPPYRLRRKLSTAEVSCSGVVFIVSL